MRKSMQLATLCYVRHGENTLMLRRVKKANDIHFGKWNGLGGKFESGESPEECVLREVHEESGLTVTDLHLAGFLSFPEFKDGVDWYVFAYTAVSANDYVIDSGEGELEWIPSDRLSELTLWEGDYIFLPWISEQRFFSAKFVYRDKKLIEHSVEFYKQLLSE